jgi:nicotinamide mononucleotide transporter PnuC
MSEIDVINALNTALANPLDACLLLLKAIYTAFINNPLEAFGVIAGIIGSFYIAGRNKNAFVFWTVSNIAMLVVMLKSGLLFAAFMYLYYLINSMFGYFNWSKKEAEA